MAKPGHSFKSGKSQAKQLAAQMAKHGQSRHEAKLRGDKTGLQGLGTERITKQVLAQYGEWLHQERRGDLQTASRQAATEYLEHRAERVGQSMINQERQALDRLQRHLHGQNAEPLPRIRSELTTIKAGRAYSLAQAAAIREAQTPKNRLMSELSLMCGLRAHEGYTLRLASEGGQPESAHRVWNPDRFVGANGQRPDGVPYTVRGKGGLIRTVIVPRELSALLEERYRLATPELRSDRGIFYTTFYGVGAGKAWSQSVSAASKRVLGWSHGGHGFRHSYAQNHYQELKAAGYDYHSARLLLSESMGHFRSSIVDAYLL